MAVREDGRHRSLCIRKDCVPVHTVFATPNHSRCASSGYATCLATCPSRLVAPMKYVNIFIIACLCAFLPAAEFRIQVKTDNAGNSGDTQFTLPLFAAETYNCTINWGDGTTPQVITTSTSPTHTYTTAGTYTIGISENTGSGGFPRIYFNNSGDRLKLLQLQQWGDVHWTSFAGAFYGCENLVITATDHGSARTSTVMDFTDAWRECRSLATFPPINTAAGISFSYAWYNCRGLTSFPMINTAAGTDFSGAWGYCTLLPSFPLIDTAAGTNFYSAWAGGSSLTSFPLINTSAGTDFSGAWYDCAYLTSFPLINTAAGTNFANAWRFCERLTSFPLINTAAGTNFNGTWGYCRGLTSFPAIDTSAGEFFNDAWIDCRNLTSFPLINTTAGFYFVDAWNGCSGLTSFPALDLAHMQNGRDCFAGVTLPTATYTALLSDLAARNTYTAVPFSGGNSRYLTSAMSGRATLIGTRSWSISDGGLAVPIITSPRAASVLQGAAFTYTVTATDSPTSFSASGVPSPLLYANGVISGTAPATTGSYPITIGATNAEGTGNATLTLYVNGAGAPRITSATTVRCVVGLVFPTYQITATGTPIAWSATNLPPGLSVNGTGAISGTPTTIGTTVVSLLASNASGTGVANLTLTITATGGTTPSTASGGGGGGCGLGSATALLLAALASLGLRRPSRAKR